MLARPFGRLVTFALECTFTAFLERTRVRAWSQLLSDFIDRAIPHKAVTRFVHIYEARQLLGLAESGELDLLAFADCVTDFGYLAFRNEIASANESRTNSRPDILLDVSIDHSCSNCKPPLDHTRSVPDGSVLQSSGSCDQYARNSTPYSRLMRVLRGQSVVDVRPLLL